MVINQRDTNADLKLQFGNSLDESILWDNSNNYFIISDSLNFEGNEIINFHIENSEGSPVACGATHIGRMYHDTSDSLSYVCNAIGGWSWKRINAVWSESATPKASYNSGNVGIGITDPVSPLHVRKTSDAVDDTAGITIEQNGGIGDAILQFLIQGVRRWVIGIDNSDGDKFKIARSADLNSDAALTIDINGNVGIGKASLTTINSKFDVVGGIMSEEIAKASVATIDLDWDAGNQQTVTLNQTGHTITFSNATAGQILRFVICQDATGSRTITSWPASVKWINGNTPTITPAANQCDVVSLLSTNARGSLEVFGTYGQNF